MSPGELLHNLIIQLSVTKDSLPSLAKQHVGGREALVRRANVEPTETKGSVDNKHETEVSE